MGYIYVSVKCGCFKKYEFDFYVFMREYGYKFIKTVDSSRVICEFMYEFIKLFSLKVCIL